MSLELRPSGQEAEPVVAIRAGEHWGCWETGFVWGEEKGHVITRQVHVVWFPLFLS